MSSLSCLLIVSALFSLAKSFQPLSTRVGVLKSTTVLQSSTVDEKEVVKNYFDNEGFNRWNKIYSDSDEVNGVQRNIRDGHQQTIDKVLNWVADEDNSKKTLCDAGCGTGSLAIPAAAQFKKVFASDISKSMTEEAASRAKASKINNIEFKVSDMEALKGQYDTLTCIDVFIHYPTDAVMFFVILSNFPRLSITLFLICPLKITTDVRYRQGIV